MTEPIDPWGARTPQPGTIFLSHWSEYKEPIRVIDKALRAHGIDTWLDEDALSYGESSTEHSIRKAIASRKITGFLIWVVDGIQNRPVIQDVEIPAALLRQAEDATFPIYFAVPRGGLPVDEAGKTNYRELDRLFPWLTKMGAAKVSDRNVFTVDEASAGVCPHEEASKLAKRVLKDRMLVLDQELDTDEPIQVQIHTHSSDTDNRRDLLLNFDWLFPDGKTSTSVENWQTIVRPGIQAVVAELARTRRPVVFGGECRFPGVILLGAASRRLGARQSWMQTPNQGGPVTRWSIMSDSAAASDFDPLLVTSRTGEAKNGRVVLTFDVSTRVARHVTRTADSSIPGPGYEMGVHVEFPPGSSRTFVPETAPSMLHDALRRVDAICQHIQGPLDVHVMGSMPAAISFILGRWLTQFAAVHTYEYHKSTDEYLPAVSFSGEGLEVGVA